MALVLFILGFSFVPERADYDQVPDDDDRALLEEVRLLLVQPIDINRASADDLLAIPWLNPLLAYRIVARRESLGKFISIVQLGDVSGMTDEQYRLLVPMVRVASRSEPKWAGRVSGRAASGPVSGVFRDWSTFQRLVVRRGPWQAVGMVEKDRGEPDWADWLGLGIGYATPHFAVLAGNQSVGSGLGLVLSGPYRRAPTSFAAGTGGPSALRLAGSAQENRLLRGSGFEAGRAGWHVAAVVSHTLRDARLNPDGTVAKLILDGVHDDSASQETKASLGETSAALTLSKSFPTLRVSLSGCGARYNRDFAPKDSSRSFCGSLLGAGGLAMEIVAGAYRAGLEGSYSSGRGGAGALELNGSWPGLDLGAGVFGYDRRYFAPLGRWRTLTDRKSRLEARARLAARTAGFRYGLSGNTYRDYALDSLPARVEAMLGYEAGRASAEMKLGRGYRLEQERLRTARLALGYRFDRASAVSLLLGDAYSAAGQGRMAGLNATGRWRQIRAGLSVGRFTIEGKGVRMYLPEPGPAGTGFGFGTSSSAWRVGLGLGVHLGRRASAGLRCGYTHKESGTFEFGSEVELGFGS